MACFKEVEKKILKYMEKICAKSISEKELTSEIYRKAHTTQWQKTNQLKSEKRARIVIFKMIDI